MEAFILFVILTVSTLYYFKKKKFEVIYTLFLSSMVAVILKYMVSDGLNFTLAPPSISVMVLSTLSVFNGFFWIFTLIYFILGISNPLNAVSGLLLGYGLGKWHSIRKKKILRQTGEVKRKVFHSVVGVSMAIPPFFIDKYLVLGAYGFMAFSLFIVRYVKIPFISAFVKETQRDTEWAGRGAFYFSLGTLLPVYLEQPWIILVVGIGDGLSTLIGRFFGYTKLYKRKSVEGTLAGLIGAWAVVRHFYEPVVFPLLLYVVAEVFAPIDDNLAIPLALSILYLV
ncbi:MAG: hypothetical protein GOU98_04815 [Candidatus Altiarchaeota archaeon]|nr:hypothetical protein [Candidatus Altiarchaeota archaeon]